MYTITYAPEAEEGLAKLQRNEPAAYKKASTMSVDEYFDELISLVRQDYANL